ncbi:MAG: hypothetical protein ACJA01_003899 [Saprospiraceae bacterium]|jgi:hypothetical protein
MAQEDKHYKFLENGDLINIPSPSSSQEDFNFHLGNWKIRNRRLKTIFDDCTEWFEFEATQDMRIVLNGLGNVDHFHASFDGKPFEGMSMRFFDPISRLWSIYWSDVSKTGVLEPPVLGSFYGDLGIFYTKDNFNGKEILVKFEWDKTDLNNPIWRQGFSEDNGGSWEWNWYMYLSKVE